MREPEPASAWNNWFSNVWVDKAFEMRVLSNRTHVGKNSAEGDPWSDAGASAEQTSEGFGLAHHVHGF